MDTTLPDLSKIDFTKIPELIKTLREMNKGVKDPKIFGKVNIHLNKVEKLYKEGLKKSKL